MMSFIKNWTEVYVNKSHDKMLLHRGDHVMSCKQVVAWLEDFHVKTMFKQHANSMIWTWISLFEQVKVTKI